MGCYFGQMQECIGVNRYDRDRKRDAKFDRIKKEEIESTRRDWQYFY